MATFDIIDAIGNGYAATWRERRWLARLALVPVAVKIFSLELVVLLEVERDFLTQAVVLLPSFFLEGWLLVRYVRLLVLDERWPEHQNAPGFRPDPRPVLAGMLTYAIVQFALRGLVASAVPNLPAQMGAVPQAEPDPVAFAAAAGLLIGAFWAFRYLWLYIPAAVGMGMGDFLRAIRGFPASFAMMGVWIVSFLPFMLILGAVAGLILSPWGEDASLPGVVDFVLTGLQATLDTIISLVSTAAITYGIRQIFENRTPGKP